VGIAENRKPSILTAAVGHAGRPLHGGGPAGRADVGQRPTAGNPANHHPSMTSFTLAVLLLAPLASLHAAKVDFNLERGIYSLSIVSETPVILDAHASVEGWATTDIGYKRHLMQGHLDLADVKWDGRRLTGKAKVVAGEPFKIVIALNGRQPENLQPTEDGQIAVYTIAQSANQTVEWKINFK
jgi:hypothetical protein